MLQTTLRFFLRQIKNVLKPPLHQPDLKIDYFLFGTEYGAWPVAKGILNSQSSVFSFGVGEDISFDISIIERYDCHVEAYDPTPRCVNWINKQTLPEKFHFHAIGLSNETKILRFFAPDKSNHVSFSQSNARSNNEMVELPVRSLSEILEDFPTQKIDLLKIDIEGSEYDVISDITRRGPLPDQVCVEFHHAMFGYTADQTRTAVNMLRKAGYRLFYVSSGGHEYAFLHSRVILS